MQLMDDCIIGDECELFPHVTLYPDTKLGNRVLIHAGAVLGAYGFGYRLQNGRHVRSAQLGWVEVGDDVEIGACDHVEMGNLTELLAKIQPAVYQEKQTKENRSSSNGEFVENVASINVKRTVKNIIERSFILENMVENGEIGVVGAMYNIETGKVEFYDEVMFIRDEHNPDFSVAQLRH